jgi:subtilisin family serine protease
MTLFKSHYFFWVFLFPLFLSLPTHGAETTQTILIHFKEQYNLSQFKEDKTKLIRVLREFTVSTTNKYFPNLTDQPGIKSVESIWITNSIRVTGSAEAIAKIKPKDPDGDQRQEKSFPILEPNYFSQFFLPSQLQRTQTAWGVIKLKAPEVWAQGFQGQGAIVAVIDSGANIRHPDLSSNIWQNPGETGIDSHGQNKTNNQIDDDNNGFVDDVHGWNFEDKTSNLTDIYGHGTQSAGVVAGNGFSGIQTGVAPKAQLMILKACCSLEGEASEFAMIEAIQYAIQNNAKIISMSLTIKPMFGPSYAQWRRAGEVEKAAGIIHINSAGNQGGGNEPYNIGAPGNNPPAWFPPDQPSSDHLTSVIAIGATDELDQVRHYSGVGPVSWEEIAPYRDFPFQFGKFRGLTKPEICAPSEVPSTSKDGQSYTQSFGGTSSATPHVAGVAALLISIKPEISPSEMTEILQMSANPLGSSLINNQCGSGRVDALRALEYLGRVEKATQTN